jgi:hypothetical protein
MEEYSEVWRQTLAALKSQMAEATFNAHLASTEVAHVSGSVWTVSCPANSVEWLKHRLGDVVQGALAGTTGETVVIEWINEEQPVYFAAEVKEEETKEEANVHGQGAFFTEWSAIVRPLDVEVFTQYFRREWRPILGTLRSELIRELRQRCFHSKHDPSKRRDEFDTTYLSLAKALKVSERTIIRLLERDEKGFKDKYLGYFIKSIKIKKFRRADGKIRNEGTKFIIYLDEPLTPKDEAKLRAKLKQPE